MKNIEKNKATKKVDADVSGSVSLSKLDKLKQKRDKIKISLNKPDPIQQCFYGGKVGFKSGRAKQKWEKSIDKELDLMRQLSEIEQKISRLENPLKRIKSENVSPSIWNVGETAFAPLGTKVTIIKINLKSVTIQYEGGFKETIKPHLLSRY